MEIRTRTLEAQVEPQWQAFVDAQAARLEARHPRALSLEVSFAPGRHHRQGTDEVDLLLTLPGRQVRVGKQEPRMMDALHAAFEALERQLEAFEEERRGFGKPPGARPQGIVKTLFPDRDYGFVLLPGGDEVYFHRHALHGLDFDALVEGQPVELEVEQGKRGPQASRVFPVGERWTA